MANTRVAINGFGRIGRLTFRAFLEAGRKDLEFVAINDLGSADMNALLLEFDSVHGRFPGAVTVADRHLKADGQDVAVLSEADPEKLPWGELGVDIVMECTGRFTKRETAAQHLDAGAKRVLVSAPCSGADLTVVYGVNDDKLTQKDHVVSNASCTTNCLAPVAKVLHEEFAIREGLMTTIHAYTGSQPVLDHVGSDPRRSRSAATNIVPTSTGAAKAVGSIIPELQGKLNGCAYRVPIPTVSIAELVANVETPAAVDTVNAAFEKASAEPPLEGILGYSPLPLVSTDFQGTTFSSVLDGLSTMVVADMVKVAAWYDNEWGYACRVAELAHYLVQRGF
jgi:glyceraldehyde 3-phosphate dehydrogenase